MVTMTPSEWINNGDLGNAAIVIWSVMTKNVNEAGGYVKPAEGEDGQEIIYTYRVPKNSGAFYRCYKLLKLFPDWRNKLNKVSAAFPEWDVFVKDWDTLSAMCDANPMAKEADANGEDYHNNELNRKLLELYRESEAIRKRKGIPASTADESPKRGFLGLASFSQIFKEINKKDRSKE
jgi:hypothetical protein